MAIKGIFTSDMGIVGDRKADFASSILYNEPNGSAPMLAMTSGMKTRPATDVVVTWFEENHLSGRVRVTNNAGTGTTLVLEDASFITANTVLMLEDTGEYVFVLAAVGNTLTVERGFADTEVASINGSGSNEIYAQRIGTAFSEASSAPVAVTNMGYPKFNYTQIFRNTWNVSGTAQAVPWHTGSRVAKSKRDCALYHAEDIERSLMWGRKSLGVMNNEPFRTMDGILTQVKTNVFSQTTNFGYTDMRDFLEKVFSRNIKGYSNERIAFCGNSVLSVLDTIAMSHGDYKIEVGETDFGMEIVNWRTPFGKISLKTHPLMNENPVWRKDMYVLHPGVIETRYLRRTTEDNYDGPGKRAGVDADYGVLTTELSVTYGAEITGGIYTGIDTPRTDTL